MRRVFLPADSIMSIVAMKRKSRRFKAPVSGRGTAGFSLNGGRRNQGWVGQGSLGRSLGGTRFRGAEPMGHGGSYGTYRKSIVNSGSCCTNDPDIIKRSNINMPGLISSRLTPRGAVPLDAAEAERSGSPRQPERENIPGSCCKTSPVWVKDFSELNRSQSQRLRKVKAKSGRCVVLKSDAGRDRCGQSPAVPVEKCKAASYHIGGRKVVRTMYSKNLNPLAVDQSQYIEMGALMGKNDLPTPPCKAPYPSSRSMMQNCREATVTAAQGKAAGEIVPSWGKCDPCIKPGLSIKMPTISQEISVGSGVRDYTEEELDKLYGQRLDAILADSKPTSQRARRPMVDASLTAARLTPYTRGGGGPANEPYGMPG